MSTRSIRSALGVALCLVMIVLPLSLDGLDFRTFGGYPAVGFAVALLLLSGRRWLGWALLVETVLVSAALTRTYDIAPVLGLLGSITVTVPALLVWHLLTRGGRRSFEVDSLAGERRFFRATTLGAAVCAVIGGLLSLAEVSASDALLTGLMSFLSALAAQLAVLPVIPRSPRSSPGHPAERILMWVVLLIVVPAVFLPDSSLPVVFLLPAALSWSANRGATRSSHYQLLVVSVAAYLFTFNGRGPFAQTPAGMPEITGPIMLYLFLVASAYAAIPISASISRLQAVTAEATASASTMERLFESARQSMIITTDAMGVITRVNRGAELILGYDAAELLGRNPAVLHSEEELVRQARRRGLADDDFRGTVEAMAKSGERWDWEVVTRNGPALRLGESHHHRRRRRLPDRLPRGGGGHHGAARGR